MLCNFNYLYSAVKKTREITRLEMINDIISLYVNLFKLLNLMELSAEFPVLVVNL